MRKITSQSQFEKDKADMRKRGALYANKNVMGHAPTPVVRKNASTVIRKYYPQYEGDEVLELVDAYLNGYVRGEGPKAKQKFQEVYESVIGWTKKSKNDRIINDMSADAIEHSDIEGDWSGECEFNYKNFPKCLDIADREITRLQNDKKTSEKMSKLSVADLELLRTNIAHGIEPFRA